MRGSEACVLCAEHLWRIYGSGDAATVALRDITLRVTRGSFVAIIGRSGAGKSTLLYQLSLLDRPSQGEIWFLGTPTAALSENERLSLRRAHLGYVFQDYALLPELTAEENVMLPIIARGHTISEARTQARCVLKRVGLEARLAHRPAELSGGEQQRVSIARAIVDAPDILFADEPTANLDSRTSREVLNLFVELHREGLTIVMVTHELSYAAYANRVVVLHDGRIVDDGPPAEVLARFREEASLPPSTASW